MPGQCERPQRLVVGGIRRYIGRRLDNVTHTLAGLAVAEAALAVRRRRGGSAGTGLTRAAWLGSALANNVPDLDFAYAPITDGPLGYMLHHRGHTHTFVLAPLVALLPFAVARVMARRWGESGGRASDAFLYALCLGGCLLHIAMDGANTYGVHPFWPLSGAWHFGDAIFIVEPAWWLTLAVPLAFSVKARAGRGILFSIAALALILPVATGLVSSLAVAALALLALALIVGARRLGSDGARAGLAVGASLLVPFTFVSARALAEPRARAALDGAFPAANEIDLVMMPEPGNPLCWSVLAVAVEEGHAAGEAARPASPGAGGTLVLRRLVVAAIPALHPALLCRMTPRLETTADDVPIVRPGHDDVLFFLEARVPIDALRAVYLERCDAAAFLRLSRAPFLAEHEGVRVLGDYRFDNEERLSFAELPLPEPPGACPAFVPGWAPPRGDVLEGTYPPEVRPEDTWE